MQTIDPKKTIILIDGSSFLYRAYYSLRPLHSPEGIPVQAVYSFCRMIKKIIDTFKPEYIALVWDSKGKTIRHEMYSAYKQTRQEPPSDLFTQKEYIQTFADLIGMTQIAQTGVEADDLMYSLAKDFEKKETNTLIITSDKDMSQTLSNTITIFDPFKDAVIDSTAFGKTMGFSVQKFPFYYALLGDASDNIPGVHGIGKKGAHDLVTQFNSLEELYQNLDKVSKERTRKALEEHKQDAFLSLELFLLRYYDLGKQQQDFFFDAKNWANALPLFEKLAFKTLIKEIQGALPMQKTDLLSQTKGYLFKTIQTAQELATLCHEIQEKKLFALDTELSGLRALQDDVVGLCICTQKGISYYIPFGHHHAHAQLSREQVLAAFKPILANPTIKKIMHHAKFDQLALAHYGIEVQGLIFDTLIAAHLVTQDWQRIGLKYISEYYLQEKMLSFAEVVTKNGYKNFAEVPLTLATEYAAADAHQTLRLEPILRDELKKQAMEILYDTIEFPLIEILLHMAQEGIYLDATVLKSFDKYVTRDLAILHDDIIALIGEQFKDINLNSPKQLSQLLFEHLKLPPQKKTMGKTSYSTDQEVLEALSDLHPVPRLIVKYRELFKLKSTYIDTLPTFINPETGCIHSNFSQTAVATGRLASSEPNLQNIPTDSAYYPTLSIRSAFKPKKEHIFLAADYSQIELRVLAYLSQDDHLVAAFLHGEDIHRTTAAKLFDVPAENVTKEQRTIGKRINFSILYGLTPYGLSKDLDIPFKDAKTYIDKYFAQYPKVSIWMDTVIAETKQYGFVTTHWGRRRYIPGIYEENKTLYDLARRIAINTKAQGTAAELMKLGMIAVTKALKTHNLDAKIVLQIHDELLLSVPEQEQEKTVLCIKETLEHVVDWNVPLEVSIQTGANWQEVSK